jgi:hypothetical protein
VTGQVLTVDPTTGTVADPNPVTGSTQDALARSGAKRIYTNGTTEVWQDADGNTFEIDAATGETMRGQKFGGPVTTLDSSFDPVKWAEKTTGLTPEEAFDKLPDDPLGTPGIEEDNPFRTAREAEAAGGTGKDYLDAILGNVGVGGGAGGAGGFGLTSNITDPIQAAIAQQNAIAQQMGQERANFAPTAAPTIARPDQIQAAMAGQVDPIQAAIAQAERAQAAQIGQTVLSPQQAAIQAQQVEAARIAQMQQAQAATIGQTQVGPVTNATAAQLDQTQQAEMRAAQQGLISGLQGAIAGKEPSVAEIMLRNATDRNVANQYALAQAANGMNTGLAQRTAMINAAEMNQQAIMQQAILRAQEIAQARGQLGGALDSARGADLSLAGQQAGLQQQTNLANAGAANTANLTQAQLAQAQAIAQAQLQQGASQFNAQASNAATMEQAQLQQAAALANQQAGLTAGTANAQLAQQVALANAQAQNQTNQQNAALQQAAALQNAQLGTQASMANAQNQTQANTASAQLANAVNLANAQNQTQANLTSGQLQTQAAIANAQNQVSTNQLNQKAQQDLAANQLQAAGQAGQTSVGYGDVAAKMAEAEAKRQAAMIAGISAAGAALISDRREKTDVRSAEAEIAEWTSTLDPYTFRYRDPDKPGRAPGRRFGVMAQDLEKSRIGRSLVRELDDGTKAVDVGQSVGAILATLSSMNKRLGRVEAR